MTAWKNMTEEDRDRVFLTAGVLAHPSSIAVNRRSKNETTHIKTLIDRELFTPKHIITAKGRLALARMNETDPQPERSEDMTEDDVTRAGALLRSYRAAWDLFQITNQSNSAAVTFKRDGVYTTFVDYSYNPLERKIDLRGCVLDGYADPDEVEEVVYDIAIKTHHATICSLARLIGYYLSELKKLNVTPNLEPTPIMLSYVNAPK